MNRRPLAAVALLLVPALALAAQSGDGRDFHLEQVNPRYDGRFTFTEYWEWSARGYFPVDITNDAYALGVYYILYGLTH